MAQRWAYFLFVGFIIVRAMQEGIFIITLQANLLCWVNNSAMQDVIIKICPTIAHANVLTSITICMQ